MIVVGDRPRLYGRVGHLGKFRPPEDEERSETTCLYIGMRGMHNISWLVCFLLLLLYDDCTRLNHEIIIVVSAMNGGLVSS